MKISVVTAYYNRHDLFIKTLESISKTQYKGDFEIIAVDDVSKDSQRITDLPSLFPKLNLKIVRIDEKDKWWVNPCIPNNIGFGIASGDIIIIQNPECLHVGDVISHAAKNISNNKYIVFGCYGIDTTKTQLISKIDGGSVEEVYKIISPICNASLYSWTIKNRWYQHSKFSAYGLNYCTAITREDLKDLGGFDEAYANGISYDDTDFFRRVCRKGMNIDMVDDPLVVHQCHEFTDYGNKKLVDLNTNLFKATANIKTFRVFNKHAEMYKKWL